MKADPPSLLSTSPLSVLTNPTSMTTSITVVPPSLSTITRPPISLSRWEPWGQTCASFFGLGGSVYQVTRTPASPSFLPSPPASTPWRTRFRAQLGRAGRGRLVTWHCLGCHASPKPSRWVSTLRPLCPLSSPHMVTAPDTVLGFLPTSVQLSMSVYAGGFLQAFLFISFTDRIAI